MLWLCAHGVMPLYTPVGGSWLNMAKSIERVLKRRALDGQHPHSPEEIGRWFEQTARGWNEQPTPFVWNGKRRQRRRRSGGEPMHRLGGSGACTHKPLKRSRSAGADKCQSSQQTTHDPLASSPLHDESPRKGIEGVRQASPPATLALAYSLMGSLDPTNVVAALAHAGLARNAPGCPGRGLSLALSDVGLSLRCQLRVSRHPLSVRARPSVGLGRGRRDRWSDPLLNRSDALGGPAAPSEKKDHHETSKPTHDSPSGGS